MMIAPKLLYVFVMTMSATLAFLPHQAAASDFEILTPQGQGICPSGKAVTQEECFDAAKEVDNGVDVNIRPLEVGTWEVGAFFATIPCGCSIFSTLDNSGVSVTYNLLEGSCDSDYPFFNSLVCRKTTAGGGDGKF